MIYHKTCALEGCEVEFDTNMERKKYCCDDHYKIGNRKRAKANHKKRKQHKCPCCGEFKSNQHHRFCKACADNIVQRNLNGLVGNEIYF